MKKHDSVTTLPVSIPLSLLTQDIINKIQRRSNSLPDIIQSTMAPPTSRLKDAQLLVAFSNVARDQAPGFRSAACPGEPRCSKNIATTPEDLPRRPDEPKPARIIYPPASDNYTQTENDDYDLIEIIKAYKITRRQILRLICNTDYNNNQNKTLTKAQIIEIVDEKEPNEGLLEELKAHSDHQKRLILKNYNAVRPGARHDVYDFITKCLVVSNLEPEGNDQNAIGNLPAIASNEIGREVSTSPVSPNVVPFTQMANHHTRPMSPITPEIPPTPEQPRVQQPPAPEQLRAVQQPPAPEQPRSVQHPPAPAQPRAVQHPPAPEQPRVVQHPPAPEQLRAPPQPPAQPASPELFSAEKAKTAQYHMMRVYQLMNPSMQRKLAASMALRNFPRMPSPNFQPHQPTPGHSSASAPMPGPSFSYVQHHQANYGPSPRFHSIPPGFPGTESYDNPKQKPATITSGAYEYSRSQQNQQSATQGNYSRMQMPPRHQHVFNNMGNMPPTSSFGDNMSQPFATPQEMFQAPLHTPNRYTWEQQVPMGQQMGEAYTSRRGRRPKTTSTREANLPVPPMNKYKYMMGQQKQLEVERQQQLAFHTQLGNYPNTAWNMHTN